MQKIYWKPDQLHNWKQNFVNFYRLFFYFPLQLRRKSKKIWFENLLFWINLKYMLGTNSKYTLKYKNYS